MKNYTKYKRQYFLPPTQNFDWVIAPRVRPDGIYEHGQQNRPIRVYHTLDTRMTMEDFYAKLLINYPPEYLKGVF